MYETTGSAARCRDCYGMIQKATQSAWMRALLTLWRVEKDERDCFISAYASLDTPQSLQRGEVVNL